MSDLASDGWQRRPARDVTPVIGARGVGPRLLLRRPLLTATVLLAVLAGLVAADFLAAADDPAPAGLRAAQPSAAAPALPRAPADPARDGALVSDSILAPSAPVQPASARLGPRPSEPVGVATSPWLEVIRPIEIFSLDANQFSKAARSYRARRRSEGGGREDTMALGTLGAGLALHLSVYRRGSEAYRAAPFFSDIVRQAAEAGLAVTRSGLPDLLPTRFGAFEVAEVSLSGGPASALPCSGYRLVLDVPALTITGLACSGPTPLSRAGLRCLLERLDVASGGSDRTLVDFFAASELKRSADCAGRLAPDQVHAAWLDDRSATPRWKRRGR